MCPRQTDLGPFDYSGLRAGARVMGVAQSAKSVSAVPDETLQWAVPVEWSDQEAATVPVAYAMVSQKDEKKTSETLWKVSPGP